MHFKTVVGSSSPVFAYAVVSKLTEPLGESK